MLHDVMQAAIGDRDIVPAAICLGIAGVDRPDDSAVVRGIMRRIGFKARILVVNDALVALEAGAPGRAGVVIISGTGSIAYGRNDRNEGARVGGWGHVLGDEGSGYWIGRRALSAVVREVDGRGPRTALTADVLAHFGVPDAAGLVSIVYNRDVPRQNVATLGPTVQRASERGDAVARQILERAGEELTLAAASVASRLEMRGDAFPFVLAGGMFRVVPALVDELRGRTVSCAMSLGFARAGNVQIELIQPLRGEGIRSGTVVLDSVEYDEKGDVVIPLREGAIAEDHIVGELGEVLAGTAPGRTSPDDITLFESAEFFIQKGHHRKQSNLKVVELPVLHTAAEKNLAGARNRRPSSFPLTS